MDIRQEICHQLGEPCEVYVTIQGEEVVLDGTVATYEERQVAEDIARRSPGVSEVHNHLRIHQDDHPAVQLEERF